MTLKGNQNSNFAQVGTPGAGFDPVRTPLATAPLADEFGRLIVIIDTPAGDHASGMREQFVTSGDAFVSQFLVGAVDSLDAIAGYNASTVPGYVQIWQTLNTTIDVSASLKVVIPVAANRTTFSYGLAVIPGGIFRPNYIIALSSTEFVFTALASPALHVTANFRGANA